MRIGAESSLREVAFVVCTALDRIGVTAVLSGGGAAALYAPEAIQSFDLDFILTVYVEEGDPIGVLEQLGYRRVGHDYKHRESPYPLEFPPGPLAVGDELIEHWSSLREAELVLHALTPTDSCRDRLAAFYHFGDRSSLEQARAVYAAQADRIDLDVIRGWSKREGHEGGFEEFLDQVGGG